MRPRYKQRPEPLISEPGCVHCTLSGVGEKEEVVEGGMGLRSGYHDHEHAELNVVFSDSDTGSPITQLEFLVQELKLH